MPRFSCDVNSVVREVVSYNHMDCIRPVEYSENNMNSICLKTTTREKKEKCTEMFFCGADIKYLKGFFNFWLALPGFLGGLMLESSV